MNEVVFSMVTTSRRVLEPRILPNQIDSGICPYLVNMQSCMYLGIGMAK